MIEVTAILFLAQGMTLPHDGHSVCVRIVDQYLSEINGLTPLSLTGD
jgi:hypothetical protein